MTARSTASRRAAAAGPTRNSRSGRCSPARPRTCICGRATSSAVVRSGAAACSRSATRRSVATSNQVTGHARGRAPRRAADADRDPTRVTITAAPDRSGALESDAMPTLTIEPMTTDGLAVRPPHLRRGHRDRRRHARARGARLGPLRPVAPRRLPLRRPRGPDGPILGWTALSGYSARRVYSGIAWESVYVAPEARGRGVGRALLETLIPASEAAGVWTLMAGVMLENAASLALHERVGFRRVGVQERVGQDASGRWRDVVLLERRSGTVGIGRDRPGRRPTQPEGAAARRSSRTSGRRRPSCPAGRGCRASAVPRRRRPPRPRSRRRRSRAPRPPLPPRPTVPSC